MNIRILITSYLLFFALFSNAQAPYRCLIPDTTFYFLNAGNYLRGMQIDSVRSSGTDTIYYPFHSLRGLTARGNF